VEHAAQNVSPLDGTVPHCTDEWNQTLLINALMWTRVIVIRDVLSQRSVIDLA
jgi:hypothetical protein